MEKLHFGWIAGVHSPFVTVMSKNWIYNDVIGSFITTHDLEI